MARAAHLQNLVGPRTHEDMTLFLTRNPRNSDGASTDQSIEGALISLTSHDHHVRRILCLILVAAWGFRGSLECASCLTG